MWAGFIFYFNLDGILVWEYKVFEEKLSAFEWIYNHNENENAYKIHIAECVSEEQAYTHGAKMRHSLNDEVSKECVVL